MITRTVTYYKDKTLLQGRLMITRRTMNDYKDSELLQGGQ